MAQWQNVISHIMPELSQLAKHSHVLYFASRHTLRPNPNRDKLGSWPMYI